MEKLFEVLQFQPSDIELYKKAFTHSSFANENDIESNERLEFLGDAVLEILVSDYLFKQYKKYSEGQLTKLRSKIVCEDALFIYSEYISLKNYLIISKAEENNGGRNQKSKISDSFEALFGAIYLDKGIEQCRKAFNILMIPYLDEVINMKDYKTLLQELVQSDKRTLQYNVINTSGPAHDREFEISVTMDDIVMGVGIGKSKKEAEQNAAAKALKKLA